jgi:hypothetical protein
MNFLMLTQEDRFVLIRMQILMAAKRMSGGICLEWRKNASAVGYISPLRKG